jgi:predicted patatin/cPLA2 family phospholipase
MKEHGRKERIALITSGGGMRCAYAAGALVTLAKRLGYVRPDIFISASGSVAAMFYYLAGQYDDIEHAWLRYVPSPEMVRLFPPRLRLDYVVDTILRRELPLDEDALRESPTRWFVPVTDLATGRTRFVTNDEWYDPYEVMRAAKALPLLYGAAVRLGARPYIDGDISVNMAELIKKARHEGATKIFVITNTFKLRGAMRAFALVSAAFAKPMIRELLARDQRRAEWDHLPADVDILIIGPSYPLPLATFTRIRRKVLETYQMGVADLLVKRDTVLRFLDSRM